MKNPNTPEARRISDTKNSLVRNSTSHDANIPAKTTREVRQIIQNEHTDIVHALYGSVNGYFAIKLGHQATVVTFQGSDLNGSSNVNFIRNYLTLKASAVCYKKSISNIAVSEALKNKIPEPYQSKTIVIPTGVDEDIFKPIPRDEAREKLRWKQDEKVVFFNGNNPGVKRLDLALEVIELVKKEFPTARLEILDGSINPENIPLMLNASDVLLLCSDNEGSPTVVKEAMACNIPIVCNVVGDTRERLENVKGALLTSQNPDELANKIIEIFSAKDTGSYNLRESFIEQKLGQRSGCEKIIAIYENIVNKLKS